MTTKEKFMQIKSHKEFELRKSEFKGKLDYSDKEILRHFEEIFPTLNNSDYEKGIIVDVF